VRAAVRKQENGNREGHNSLGNGRNGALETGGTGSRMVARSAMKGRRIRRKRYSGGEIRTLRSIEP